MKRLLALAFAVAAFACTGGSLVMAPMMAASAAVDAPPAPPVVDAGASAEAPNLVGRWSGTGQQSDGQSWELSLDVASAGTGLHARVSYPRLPCAGEWTLESAAPREWVGSEHIASGTDHCVENGVVHVRLTDAGALEFDWREIGGHGATAHGTLRRAGLRR